MLQTEWKLMQEFEIRSISTLMWFNILPMLKLRIQNFSEPQILFVDRGETIYLEYFCKQFFLKLRYSASKKLKDTLSFVFLWNVLIVIE